MLRSSHIALALGGTLVLSAIVGQLLASTVSFAAVGGSTSSNARPAGSFVDSFSVSCATTATEISAPSGQAQGAYYCQTPQSAETGGSTLVAVGDSAIADPDISTRNSPVYSGSTIREFYAAARKEYCRADTGTVTIYCRAIVPVEP